MLSVAHCVLDHEKFEAMQFPDSPTCAESGICMPDSERKHREHVHHTLVSDMTRFVERKVDIEVEVESRERRSVGEFEKVLRDIRR